MLDSLTYKPNLHQTTFPNNERQDGSWILVKAHGCLPECELKILQGNHVRAQSKMKRSKRSQFVEPQHNVTSCCDYIAFIDAKHMIFYNSNLASTPSQDIVDGSTMEAIVCVCGLVPIEQWVNCSSILHKTVLWFIPIAVYNKCRGGVDHVDQCVSTNSIQQKEV